MLTTTSELEASPVDDTHARGECGHDVSCRPPQRSTGAGTSAGSRSFAAALEERIRFALVLNATPMVYMACVGSVQGRGLSSF